MKRKSFGAMNCPVARGLERVGDGWGFLILRDALNGMTRFEQFREHLDIAPTTLTRRLDALVAEGLLERRRYAERPPRDDYVLTERGHDFRPVVLTLFAWGARHFTPEGHGAALIDTRTGREADPILIDAVSGRLVSDPAFKMTPRRAAADANRNAPVRRRGRDRKEVAS
jgi:DNA-binding HxlR family transcriptional regulator